MTSILRSDRRVLLSRRSIRLIAPGAVAGAVIIAVLALTTTTMAQEERCLSCHREKMQGRSVHEAMQARMGCRVCHAGILAAALPHKLSTSVAKGLQAEPPLLCYSCHEKKNFTKSRVHEALASGCTACHDPHVSTNERLLTEPQPAICYRCHRQAQFTNKVRHDALEMGCTACHDPHASERANLLAEKQPGICFRCHDRAAFIKRVRHGALGIGCVGCHEAHAAKNGKLLSRPVPVVCFACHDRKAFIGAHAHGPVAAGACQVCHEVHSSDGSGLLVKPLTELCLFCHDAVAKQPHFTVGEGPPFVAFPACDNCHDPHGTESRYLLRSGVAPTAGP